MASTGCSSHFTIGIAQSALGMHFNKTENGTIFNLKGYEFNLLSALATALNFSYTLVDVSGMAFGSEYDNGSWSGIIGELEQQKLDLSLATLTVTNERMRVVDFTPPYFIDNINFFINKKEKYEHQSVFYVEPFEGMTWLLLIISLLTYGILLQLFLDKKQGANGRAIIYIFGNILQQGYRLTWNRNRRKRRSIAILIVFTLLTSNVISIFYTSCLTASASVSDTIQIDTIDQLVPYFERKEMEIGVLDGSNYFDFVMKRASSKMNSDLLRMIVRVLRDGDYSFLQQLAEGKLAYLSGVKYFLMEMHELGQSDIFYVVKETLCTDNLAMAMKKNFTCKNQFGKIMNLLRETGCFDKWEHDLTFEFERSRNKKSQRGTNTYSPINRRDLDSVFLLCFGGLLIAFLIYNVERAVISRRNRDEEITQSPIIDIEKKPRKTPLRKLKGILKKRKSIRRKRFIMYNFLR